MQISDRLLTFFEKYTSEIANITLYSSFATFYVMTGGKPPNSFEELITNPLGQMSISQTITYIGGKIAQNIFRKRNNGQMSLYFYLESI